jgi:hypothetical protein
VKKIQICNYCRSCNIDIGIKTNIVMCLDCERVNTKENTITLLVEKECVDCGINTDYALKH